MTALAGSFQACNPTPWTGRYDRIPGDSTVFHLEYVDRRLWPVIQWNNDGACGTCRAIQSETATGLADAVTRAKRFAGGSGGGSFLINEFGQVLVPASDGGGRRYFAGELHGRLLFENPFSPDAPIDLWDDSHLQPGNAWELPYIGMPYHLSRKGLVYFYCQDVERGRSLYPPRQDAQLIRALRSVRPWGAVRFIVTPAGFVLTKRPIGDRISSEPNWQPVFVGSISHNLWFEKE